MSRYEEIKKLLDNSRSMLNKDIMKEEYNNIRSYYGLLKEENEDDVIDDDRLDKKIDPLKSIESKIEYETADENEEEEKELRADKSKTFRISGGLMTIHGKTNDEIQLTTDEKAAFQESRNEFMEEVADIVDFNKLNLYTNNVEWSGKITELDVEFFFSIGETNGVYINGTMSKVDDEFLEMLNKLKTYYDKFKSKWGKILSTRKKTMDQ